MKNLNSRILRILFVIELFASIASVLMAQVPTLGMVAYYPLNGNGTDLGPYHAFADTVSNGAPTPPLPTTDRFGRPGMAMLFGDGNYLEASDTLSIPVCSQMQGDFTMAGWIKPLDFSTTDGGDAIVSLQNLNYGIQEEMFAVNDSGEDIWFFNSIGTGSLYSSANSLQWDTSTWVHLAVTKHDSLLTFYINSVMYGTGISSIDSFPLVDSSSIYIASSPWGTWEILDGSLDDVYLYNRALSDTEISMLFNALPDDINNVPATSLSIFPNPAQDQVTIQGLSLKENASVCVMDLAGQTLLTSTNSIIQTKINLNVQSLASGMYLVEVRQDGAVYTGRFVKTN